MRIYRASIRLLEMYEKRESLKLNTLFRNCKKSFNFNDLLTIYLSHCSYSLVYCFNTTIKCVLSYVHLVQHSHSKFSLLLYSTCMAHTFKNQWSFQELKKFNSWSYNKLHIILSCRSRAKIISVNLRIICEVYWNDATQFFLQSRCYMVSLFWFCGQTKKKCLKELHNFNWANWSKLPSYFYFVEFSWWLWFPFILKKNSFEIALPDILVREMYRRWWLKGNFTRTKWVSWVYLYSCNI